jgi:hypothetical protein
MRANLLSLVVVVGLLLAATSAGASDEVRRRGSCTGGSGHWELRVRRETRTSLRVRFSIENVPPGHTWQLFLSDNGSGVLARSKVSTSSGEVRIRKVIRNRPGVDRIRASGVDLGTGELCTASLRY